MGGRVPLGLHSRLLGDRRSRKRAFLLRGNVCNENVVLKALGCKTLRLQDPLWGSGP